ncbi:hypothetical protein FY034_07330 [Trichlorobacter lovleyi]|uniref:hypothetical protein n=1 Tax=Trichlorobacter lovleyi TaxID=313985 RepID=UPI00223ECD0A|nr:hypothetical protein [Trichlorobacter lovleyi]QOX78748.1 hypothetical protein FY034_07330 [Trichlorobacter lovleyi]
MSENYQYADCKHCGKSIMEGEIHGCRQMLLAEIADCHATMLRQAQQIDHWKEQAAIYKDQKQDADDEACMWKKTALAQGEGLARYIIDKDRYREALQKIIETGDKCNIKYEAVHLMTIAREALADRP